MKTRFFYAPQAFNTWPKLFVLTEDGILYCEYLNFMSPATIRKKVDFENFKASDYSYQGYQKMEEIDEVTAKNKVLKSQTNWIARYLNRLSK
jgi:hypothetical protein